MADSARKQMLFSVTANAKHAVVVAGAGVAGLEFVLALRDLASERVEISVVDPGQEFVYEPNAVIAARGSGDVERFDLPAFLREVGAHRIVGTVNAVDAERHEVVTSAGVVNYDTLVLAYGARRAVDVPGAFTFDGSESVAGFREIVAGLRAGAVKDLVFAVPRGVFWHLPLYELALEAALVARREDLNTTVTIVTPEEAPLGLFGLRASDAIKGILAEASVDVIVGDHVVSIEDDCVRLLGARTIPADAVVMVPRLRGREVAGLPNGDDGFVAADADGRVMGLDRAFVIGDASPFPVKQGGIATQQADTVASLVAALAGVDVEPWPFAPVLRGLLLTGSTRRYLRSELEPGHGESSDLATEPLWWPPAKISGRYLGPFLAERVGTASTVPTPSAHIAVDVELEAESTKWSAIYSGEMRP